MKNKTHTHKGNCQVCGRIQAVDVNHNSIAKHGYTVDFGFFEGVCEGSGELPLQIDKSITEKTILRLKEFVESQSAYLQGLESGEIKNLATYWVKFKMVKEGEDKVVDITNTKKALDRNYDYNRYYESFAYADGESFAKHNESRNENCVYRNTNTAEEMMQELIVAEKIQTKGQIKRANYVKKQLVEMVSEVHGQPLINVADTDKILKELESEAKEGFYETNVVTVDKYNYEKRIKEQVKVRRYISFDNIAERETSIGTVAIKVSRPNLRKFKAEKRYLETVTVNCLLNGKRIARAKLIEQLQ